MTEGTRQLGGQGKRRISDEAIAATILRLVSGKGRAGSIGPGDAARALAPDDWQSLLPRVRQAAIALVRQGQLEILRKGKPADPAAFKGVYRLRVSADPTGERN